MAVWNNLQYLGYCRLLAIGRLRKRTWLNLTGHLRIWVARDRGKAKALGKIGLLKPRERVRRTKKMSVHRCAVSMTETSWVYSTGKFARPWSLTFWWWYKHLPFGPLIRDWPMPAPPPAESREQDMIQTTLNAIGVKYSHQNDEILVPSRIEEERTKKMLVRGAFRIVCITSWEKP